MSNVTLALLRDRANKAASEQLKGDRAHGTAGILAVATLVDGIRNNLFIERTIAGGKAVTYTFTINHAQDCARLYYNRFDHMCQDDVSLVDFYKEHGRVVSTQDSANDWRKFIISLLLPYEYNGMTFEPRTDKSKVLKPYDKGSPKHTAARKAVDDIDYKRKVLNDAFPIACLYVARDMHGKLWMDSNTDVGNKAKDFGLWVNSHDLLPIGTEAVAKNKPVLCKPLKGASVVVMANQPDDNTGSDKLVEYRATLAQFAKAWRIVEQSQSTDHKEMFTKTAALVTPDYDIPANARQSFDAALNAMLRYKTEVLDKVQAKDKQVNSNKEQTAHDIANRPSVTLKDGTNG